MYDAIRYAAKWLLGTTHTGVALNSPTQRDHQRIEEVERPRVMLSLVPYPLPLIRKRWWYVNS